MNFKSVCIVKFPPEATWKAMFLHLPDTAKEVKELNSITEKERTILSPGVIKVVNEWSAGPKLPSMIAKYIKPDMLIWTDTGVWKENEKEVSWQIESHHFRKDMYCEGSTLFEPALGNTGCKMTFGGKLEWNGKLTSLGFGILDKTLSKTIEGILTQMIPSNFRKICDALGNYIARNPGNA